MSDHHQHTEFLKHCLGYDDSTERHQMMAKLVRLQHELRIVRRAAWLVAFLMGPAVACLGYSAFFLENFPHNAQRHILNLMLALLIGLVFSLLAFAVFGMVLRRKMHRQREECRQLLKHVLATRLGPNPPTQPLT